MQDFRGETLLFAQQAEQQVLSADVLLAQPLGLFGTIGQHALALMAQRQIDRSRHFFAERSVAFDLFPNGVDRRVRTQEPVRQRFVFPQQAQ